MAMPEDGADGTSGAEAATGLDGALARLRGRFVQMHQQRAILPDDLDIGPASHPLADLCRLSAFWRNKEIDEAAIPPPGETLPGPATIALVAGKLGLEVFWESGALDTLEAEDFPAVILLRDGGSRLALSLRPNGQVQILGPEGLYELPLAPLAKIATGTIFRVEQHGAHRLPEAAPMAAPPVSPLAAAPAPDLDPPREEITAPAAMGSVGLFRAALVGQRTLIINLCLAALLINILGLALPLFSMAVYDRVIPHNAFDTLWALALGVGLALTLEAALRQARLKLVDAVGLSASFDLQGRLATRLLFAPIAEVPRAAGGVLPGSQEMDNLAQIVPQMLVSVLVDMPFFIVMLVLIGSLGGSVVLAPIVAATALVAIHFLAHHMAAKSQHTQLTETRRHMQVLLDSIAGAERIRATGAGRWFLALWERVFDKAGYSAHQGRYWHGVAAQASAVIVQATIVSTIVIGVYRIDGASMTIGALSACTLLINRSLMPVSALIGLVFRTLTGLEAIRQINPLMNARIETGGDAIPVPASAIRGKLDFHRVSFQYPGEARLALREIALSIKPGEKIGIVGKAGCGKSTLLKLIARLAEPGDGRIGLDDRDLRQFDPAELRQAISYMPQEVSLLDLSLRENLTIGLPSVSEVQFERIVKLCGVQDFAAKHPSGYSLRVGQGGQRLSGGERQSVALARAMMGNPALLLLDEPTSAMDNGLEARIIAELKQSLGQTGLLIATHRLPLLALVDRVIWMDGGRIVADGPKQQIFQKLGVAA